MNNTVKAFAEKITSMGAAFHSGVASEVALS